VKINLREHVYSRRESLTCKEVPRRRLSHRIIPSILAAATLALCGAFSARSQEPIPTIRVRVLNYAGATPTTIAAAERGAGKILRDAGLKVIWIDCRVGEASENPSNPCRQPYSPTEVSLRVLSDRTGNEIPESAFGFAVPPILATVYYEPAVRHARSEGYEVTPILAGVVVHEIGHLLLGSSSHSGFGIMQGHWDRKCLQQIRWNGLQFTQEQSKLIRAEGQRRMMLESRDSLLAVNSSLTR